MLCWPGNKAMMEVKVTTVLRKKHTRAKRKAKPLTKAALNNLYPAPCPLSIAHLSATEICLYTTLLSCRPPLDISTSSKEYAMYRLRTTAIISSLAPHLLNPAKGALSKLPQSYVVTLFRNAVATDAIPSASPLCRLHHRLNAQIVADALQMLEMEAEDFLPNLLPAWGEYSMSRELSSALRAVEDFCASFMMPLEFEYWYNRQPPARWSNIPCVEKGCGACILARAADDSELLVGLRAILLARLPLAVLDREVSSPRLDWVEGWMRTWKSKGTEMLFRSGRLGEELRSLQVRRQGEAEHGARDVTAMPLIGTSGVRESELSDMIGLNFDCLVRPSSTFEPAMASSTVLPFEEREDAGDSQSRRQTGMSYASTSATQDHFSGSTISPALEQSSLPMVAMIQPASKSITTLDLPFCKTADLELIPSASLKGIKFTVCLPPGQEATRLDLQAPNSQRFPAPPPKTPPDKPLPLIQGSVPWAGASAMTGGGSASYTAAKENRGKCISVP